MQLRTQLSFFRRHLIQFFASNKFKSIHPGLCSFSGSPRVILWEHVLRDELLGRSQGMNTEWPAAKGRAEDTLRQAKVTAETLLGGGT